MVAGLPDGLFQPDRRAASTRCSRCATRSTTSRRRPVASAPQAAARRRRPGRASSTTCCSSATAHQLLYLPLFNFAHGNLDDVREMITSPFSLFGLSDAGAHCGAICDAAHADDARSPLWTRDRTGGEHAAARAGGPPA